MMIAAAAELFRKRGYRGTSIEDIGAAVGTSGPAIYRHFASKEAILVELLQRAVRRAQRDVVSALAAGLSPTETLREILRRSVAHAVEESDLVAMAAAEGRHLSRELRRRIGREQGVILREWVAVLRAVRPALSEPEAVAACRAVFALVTSAARARGLSPPATRALAERMAWAALLAGAREVSAG